MEVFFLFPGIWFCLLIIGLRTGKELPGKTLRRFWSQRVYTKSRSSVSILIFSKKVIAKMRPAGSVAMTESATSGKDPIESWLARLGNLTRKAVACSRTTFSVATAGIKSRRESTPRR